MAVDQRLMAPVRRFWTPEQVATFYQEIFRAFQQRLENVTVIIGKQTGEDSATGQVVVKSDDYLEWMEVLEARLQELDDTENAAGTAPPATEHAQFNQRFIST